MKKEQIEKILQEANTILGNYTDAQHRGQLTINQNRTTESCTKGGKASGPINGIKSRDEKTGYHAMSKEDRVKLSKEIGNRIGPRSYEEGFGIFGISKKETIKNAIAGGKASIKSPNHVNNKKLVCPHCNKEGGYTAMSRWHMHNCKMKK
jgi:hypothetical protein